jgi:hypothetical protein
VRGILIAGTAAVLALGMTIGGPVSTARAATGFESAYQFESAFLSMNQGDSGIFSAFFANTGSTAWVKGTVSQVNLAVCAADKVTCNVPSPNAAFALGWISPIAYATHQKDIVGPGDFSAFSYSISVPRGQALGTYRFNGDLVVATTGERIHPEGYYQDALVGQAPIALDVSPSFTATEDNEVSAAVPGNGQHTYTFTTTTLTGTLTFAVIPASNVIASSGSAYSFCDKNQDKKADNVGTASTVFTAVNGVSVGQSTILVQQPIPADGVIKVTVDSATRDQVVRVIGWQDKNVNTGVDLTAAGTDTTCNAYMPYDVANDGLIAVSGKKYYFGPQGSFGAQFGGSGTCAQTWLHDTVNQVFSAGATSATSLRFKYKDTDVFKIAGTRVTLSQFKNELTDSTNGTGDTVSVLYNPNTDGISEFNICTNAGADAPNSVSAATGNFDNGSAAEDVRISFTAPSANVTLSYTIQRATINTGAPGSATIGNCNLGATAPQTSDSTGTPLGSQFITVGGMSVAGGKQGTFTNFDLADGGYCFRVLVQNPTLGLNSFSNYVPVNIPGTADALAPTSTSATLTNSAGFTNTLDTGDKLAIDFSEPMSVAAGATIRVTDSDCGNATNAGPALCGGATTNTVADIICGNNATCTLQSGGGGANSRLLVTMVSNPIIVTAGSTAGVQFPVVVTDVQGVTDLSGNVWNLGASPDRVIP